MFKSASCLSDVPVAFINNVAFTVCVNTGDIKSHPAFHNDGVGEKIAGCLNSLEVKGDIARILNREAVTGCVFFNKEGLEGIPFIRYEGKTSDVYKLRGLGEIPYKIASGFTDERFAEDYVLFASPFTSLTHDTNIEVTSGNDYPIESIKLSTDRVPGEANTSTSFNIDHINSSRQLSICIDDIYLNDQSNNVEGELNTIITNLGLLDNITLVEDLIEQLNTFY